MIKSCQFPGIRKTEKPPRVSFAIQGAVRLPGRTLLFYKLPLAKYHTMREIFRERCRR